ncbi:ligase-associated DNA damage response DEXH box helicase [Taibaiella lutea]|uniref:Ligase-associated DNA damage response DEXH box helicase n=1 Tax=Taibaiella lutea TaxID=2608001 RepID=A0A5M6CAU6_9BACT|nr:ligase-associated DNA damage response DEXH box helicase [Taibaiella lutea]KAA5532298.1 ligase-associated DNA damage response DEXH box helicase [Taibaiella lutea]
MNKLAEDWFEFKGWKPYPFQRNTWKAIDKGFSGLLNAPTGCGKTYAVWFGIIQDYMKRRLSSKKKAAGLHCLWITPLRALSKEIFNAATVVSEDLELPYRIGLRTGDTSASERAGQKKNAPQALITTPESIHILLAGKGYADFFKNLEFVVVDEWHELMGSKRGVLVELALSVLKYLNPQLKIWGISATIGNLDEAEEILLGTQHPKATLIRASVPKKILIETILPDTLDKFPWAGHLGIKLADKILPIIEQSQSTLIFTNTRSQAEIWYQHLLHIQPDLAGVIALHHGSLGEELRQWVEQALHDGILKAVVCTSSLDLGVDFRPVDTVIQIGSAKGVARFLQRAGRSGHYPGATSKIYFLPTHSLEILEGTALRYAAFNDMIESRIPYIRSFDVLIQFMVTLAVSDGFNADILFEQVQTTHCFASITRDEFNECLLLITQGGKMLEAYDEFHKVVLENGLYKVISKKVAMRHRLSIGAIVSDAMMQVKYLGGKYLGSIEEWFISRLKPDDNFWFAGRNLELVMVKDMAAIVRNSKKKKGIVPSWMGGRLPLSSYLTDAIRHKLNEAREQVPDREMTFLQPLFEEQSRRSYLPEENELLIEKIETKEGFHVFMYPFEGKFVHEGMAAIIAYRLGRIQPFSFSIAMNDYGFELLSDQEIPVDEVIAQQLFSLENLSEDIAGSINTTEMARRKFRDIAGIAGLVFQGYPGKQVKAKHLQANSGLFFNVFRDYEKDNLLLRQAYEEVYDFQLEIVRMRRAFERISGHKIVIRHPKQLTPFAFPIFAEVFREKFSNESLEDRMNKIKAQLTKG